MSISNIMTRDHVFQKLRLDVEPRKKKKVRAYVLREDDNINSEQIRQVIIAAREKGRKLTFSVDILSKETFSEFSYLTRYGNILSLTKHPPFPSWAPADSLDQHFSGDLLERSAYCKEHHNKFEEHRLLAWQKNYGDCPCVKESLNYEDGPTVDQRRLARNTAIDSRLAEPPKLDFLDLCYQLHQELDEVEESHKQISQNINKLKQAFFEQIVIKEVVDIKDKERVEKYISVGSSIALTAGGIFLLISAPGGLIGGVLLNGGLRSGKNVATSLWKNKKIDLKGQFVQICIEGISSAVSVGVHAAPIPFQLATQCLSGSASNITAKVLENIYKKQKAHEGCVIAAISGGVSGLVSGLTFNFLASKLLDSKTTYRQVFDNKNAAKKTALMAISSGVSVAASSLASKIIVNKVVGNIWNQGLLEGMTDVTLMAFVNGAIRGVTHTHHQRQQALQIKEELIKKLRNADQDMKELAEMLSKSTNGTQVRHSLIEMIEEDAIAVFGEATLQTIKQNPEAICKSLLEPHLICSKVGHRIAMLLNGCILTSGVTLVIFTGGIAGSVVGGALISNGFTGLCDAITKHDSDQPLNIQDHLNKVGLAGLKGALIGAVSSPAGKIIGQIQGAGIQVAAINLGGYAMTGLATSTATQIISNIADNKMQKKEWNYLIMRNTKQAALIGSVTGTLSAVGGLGLQHITKTLGSKGRILLGGVGGGVVGGAVSVASDLSATGKVQMKNYAIATVIGVIAGAGTAYNHEKTLYNRRTTPVRYPDQGKALKKKVNGADPKWPTVRARHWKQRAQQYEQDKKSLNNLTYEITKPNLERMKKGLAPKVAHPQTGQLHSVELHHPFPQRKGGLFKVSEVAAWEHARVDKYRHFNPIPHDPECKEFSQKLNIINQTREPR